MKHNPLFAALAAMIVASAAVAAPAQGQTAASVADEPVFTTDFSIEAASDYRDRGISLSDFDPALQPSLTVTHASGIYVNAWGSNIADYGGADVEADLSLGWSDDLAEGTTVDVYATYILYPGASRLNYAEFGASLGRTIGAGSIAANLVYAPAQDGLDNLDNVYVGLSGEVPVAGTRLLLRGSLGFEDGVPSATTRSTGWWAANTTWARASRPGSTMSTATAASCAKAARGWSGTCDTSSERQAASAMGSCATARSRHVRIRVR